MNKRMNIDNRKNHVAFDVIENIFRVLIKNKIFTAQSDIARLTSLAHPPHINFEWCRKEQNKMKLFTGANVQKTSEISFTEALKSK
jgi:hypothetical protein